MEPPVAVDREKWPIFKIRPAVCFDIGMSRKLRGSPPGAAMAPMAVCWTANRHFGPLFAVERNRVVETACSYRFPVAWRVADKKRPKGDCQALEWRTFNVELCVTTLSPATRLDMPFMVFR